MSGALPNLIIIGAQKCGTTALHSYLARHPQISMSNPKELDFFVADTPSEGSSSPITATRANWAKGAEWYRGHFDADAEVRGESSPNYSADPILPGVPERMAEVIPDAKLIYLVRDPVERVRAQWIHNYSNRAQDKPLREAVLGNEEYIARSSYHQQLSRFLEHYPLERVMVIDQEDLLERRRRTLKRVFRFLEVRPGVWREAYRVKRLETESRRRKTRLGKEVSERIPHTHWRRIRKRWPFSTRFEHPEMDGELRAELASRLRDDANAFRELTGKPFENWSI